MSVGTCLVGSTTEIWRLMEMISMYLDGMDAGDDGMDAWVLDIDDTCLSNLLYYRGKQFGGMLFDTAALKWAAKGMCSAILPVLDLFNKLIERGYKVFLLTGQDDLTFRDITTANLQDQGYFGYKRLIMRTAEYKGKGAKIFKSAIRKQLIDKAYRIRDNVGDQWSDLQGDYLADWNFKIPNPMYYVS
ncbi:acid phosphatase 1 [Carex littledalei]|uniref:Acid phosphatase 1 n=1 Tax=Carex littledalei TaxID=544730 RepID=A0A833QR86_9POAL|nr:acid phosphatase 1 [Carex littledalei]